MKVDLTKQKFTKNKFKGTVDINFNQLSPEPLKGIFDLNLATVGDFFLLYNKLFFKIPNQGFSNSHQFLVEESNKQVNLTLESEIVKELTKQISLLEEEILILTTP